MSDARHRRARAEDGLWKGLNPTMALAAKGFVLVFILASVRDVDAAGAAFGHIRAWIEGTLNWYYILEVCAPEVSSVGNSRDLYLYIYLNHLAGHHGYYVPPVRS